MDQEVTEQIRLILTDADESARQTVKRHIDDVNAQHGLRGTTHSSMRVGAAIIVLEQDGSQFIKDAVDRVASVAKNAEAFALLDDAVRGFLSFLSASFDDVASNSLGGRGSQARAPQFAAALSGEWDNAYARVLRKLELHRFHFTQPNVENTADIAKFEPPTTSAESKNRGGKPLAKHWDEMWSSIAVQLYVGDLQPKTQADIERAMTGWFVDNSLDVGESTIRDRARQLWRKLQATA